VTLVFFAVYVAVTALSLPGAAILTLAGGASFGLILGTVVVSFASTIGATLAMLAARYLLRDTIQARFGRRLDEINKGIDKEGAFYLFSLRLMPAIPFFVINALMGLTRIHVVTFWWVSQLGMLPATVAYVYAGSRVPSLQKMASEGVGKVLSWQLLLAFAIIGILPLVLKWLLGRYKR